MHDIRQIRENPETFDAALARRGVAPMSSDILAIDTARREKITAAETALAERNAASKEVGAAKAKGDEAEFERLRQLVADKKEEIAALEDAAKAEDEKLQQLLLTIPNLPHDDEVGADRRDDDKGQRVFQANTQCKDWQAGRREAKSRDALDHRSSKHSRKVGIF